MAITPLMHPQLPAAAVKAEDAVVQRRSQTLVSICEVEIERMVLEGDLPRGARVNELALAARLGVSRGPVREACRSLAQAGLLEARCNRGFFVRKLAQKEVIDLYDLRAALMRLAGALIATRATTAQLARLGALVEEMEVARAHADHERFQALNTEFHGALVEAADNRRLREVCEGLAKELRLYRRRGLVSEGAMQSSNREHRAILEAIVARDAGRAAVEMERHILQGKVRFLAAAAGEIED